MVDVDRTVVSHPPHRVGEIARVISHGQHQLVGHQMFFHEIERQLVGHLTGDTITSFLLSS